MSGATDNNPSPLIGFAFAGDPLDRADHLRDDGQALAALWPDARVLVLDEQGNAHADAHGQLLAPRGHELAGSGPGTAIFLGLKDDVAWFAVNAAAVAVQAPRQVDLRRAAASWPAFEAGVFALARAMLYWHSRNRFCGICGGAVEFRRAGYTGHCSGCGNDHYPRVDPAVIVAVSDGQRLLLGRQASWPAGRYSVLAGFVEPGETLEQTVAREVYEESRVRVRHSRYLGAQPWPFPGALMLGFSAEAEPDPPQVDDELEDARWFTLEEIAAARERDEGGVAHDQPGLRLSPPISIARSLIEHWYQSMLRQSGR
ncbi:NAD(+) diphosphatase [Pseudoxanthomonas dokdonensis]|uniref:NAD(+) diphosphatase n=1 Tax=Pseudoxanthomonas dokdonensis TaxID=344882 RepID=A0A0R0CNL7_9GAMM|nr:NAD(+) diphosphatase [Pseudoxanthomonas dokdonensis]KRG71597.1 NADH pyrophosphatase [Pseudoxanthomonas dokdonensis]